MYAPTQAAALTGTAPAQLSRACHRVLGTVPCRSSSKQEVVQQPRTKHLEDDLGEEQDEVELVRTERADGCTARILFRNTAEVDAAELEALCEKVRKALNTYAPSLLIERADCAWGMTSVHHPVTCVCVCPCVAHTGGLAVSATRQGEAGAAWQLPGF
jgi:hypothetical protein